MTKILSDLGFLVKKNKKGTKSKSAFLETRYFTTN